MNGSEIRASDVCGYVDLGQVWTLVRPVRVDERAAAIHFGKVLDALEKITIVSSIDTHAGLIAYARALRDFFRNQAKV